MEEEVKAQLPVDQPEPELPTPSFWEKIKINKFKILAGVLGIFVFAGAVFGAYKLGTRQAQPTPQPTPTPLPSETLVEEGDPTANWKTYTNTKYRYSFKYPLDTQMGEPSEKSGKPSTEWQALYLRLPFLYIEVISHDKDRDLSISDYAAGSPPLLVPRTNEVETSLAGCEAFQFDFLESRADGTGTFVPIRTIFVGYQDEVLEFWVRPLLEEGDVMCVESDDGVNPSFQAVITDYDFLKRDYETFNLMLSTFRFLEEEVETGTVTGKLCYPSDFQPAGEVRAKNLSTEEVYIEKVSRKAGVYSFNLKPGRYILKFMATETWASKAPGYYSTCSKYLDTMDCKDWESWEPLPVEVIVSQTTEGIDLCDFYYVIPEKEPEF